MNEQKIVELLFERREDVLSTIEGLYGKLCHHIAMNILSSSTDAEECVNDTYMSIWNSIPPARPQSFKAYLLKTVKNISLNRVRYNSAHKRQGDCAEYDDAIASQGEDTDRNENSLALKSEINKFLEELDETSRMLFVRRYWYGDSIEYLSQISGITKSSVQRSISKSRDRLEKRLIEGGLER
jgi:RNA polymerase sigma-70 factor (ECF subfamily)